MTLAIAFALLFPTVAHSDLFDELQEWRRRNGLPLFIEDPRMTQFCRMKAQYRAQRNLQNGHQGPRAAPGWTEGTGEASPSWGILVCAMESDNRYAGAGLAYGRNGQRYMVATFRGGSGRNLINPHRVRPFNTSYLSPRGQRFNPGRGGPSMRATPRGVRCHKCGKFH